MGIHVAVEHRTTYTFDRAVTIGHHSVRLRPAPHTRTPIHAYDLVVSPQEHFLNWQQDPFGNFVGRLAFPEPATELSLEVNLVAEMTVINPFDFFIDEKAEHYGFDYDSQLRSDLTPYLQTGSDNPSPLVAKWLNDVPKPDGTIPMVDFLVGLNQRLASEVSYHVRMEPGVQTPEETLTRGIGSCRDTAWLFVQLLRELGLAARFVSGYLVQLRSDQPSLDGPNGPDKDFTDLHAWTEVYLPGAGWIGLDPTSGLFAGEGHIPLAATPHPNSAAPITGKTDQCEVEFSFENVVRRVREDPRVTLPYTDDQWNEINDLGHDVDRKLDASDVRLTMGGEPTFVSIDDMEGPEWNFEADSETKQQLANDLTQELVNSYAPKGIVQYGQGKWYPGERLPRWRKTVFWRQDNKPLWSTRTLLADVRKPGKADLEALKSFAAEVCDAFSIDRDLLLAVFEDPVPEMWAEAKSPEGEPPTELSAEEFDYTPERSSHVSDQKDADQIQPKLTGYVLPLHTTASGWGTCAWSVRRNRVYLLPGESPAGLRLPLDSLTWAETPNVYEQPTFEPSAKLPEPGLAVNPAANVVEVHEAPPTALTFELRDGHISVFLPPVESANHALHLLHVLETVAQQTGQPILIEGYQLPNHPQLQSLSVTPDPGVIEVNVHPCSSWNDLVDTTTNLYERARKCRLGTEKFALDGKHTGTGGGNHVTLGGATPADSPMLRRPDLLRSLLTFWQRHPALSYVFSGQFIGPTSQAPRVDEARHDSLYELEIAFQQLAEHGGNTNDDVVESSAALNADDMEKLGEAAAAKPWLTDRLLRNLLVDLTGNTHRAEFCIDKLYNPDSDTGRLGLLEMRAFEMPPHHQMALVQALLLRSLVARFWDSPYTDTFTYWGTELHNKFMLGTHVADDLTDVVADLNSHGIDFKFEWFEPFLEFRFPILGETSVDGVGFQLRSAIEPWHVLAEQLGDGSARYVDSSIERVEVLATGYDPNRHILTVNGHPVPMLNTELDRSVAGIRFKAWAPPSSLHPTIGSQSPLRFDLIDRTTGRSVGGFTYHSTHPGGRSYDTFPVNASEAEARRVSRFSSLGRSSANYNVEKMVAKLTMRADPNWGTLDLRSCYPADLYLHKS